MVYCLFGMRILHVIHRYLPQDGVGGTTTYLADLCAEQVREHDVRVFCGGSPRSDGVSSDKHEVDGVPVVRVSPRQQDWRWHTGNAEVNAAFSSFLREFRPDVVHIHTILLLSNDIPAIARAAGIPVVFTIHDQWFVCLKIFPLIERAGHCRPCYRRGAWRCFLCMREELAARKDDIGVRALFSALWYAWYSRPRAMRRVFRNVDRFLAPSQWMLDYCAGNGFDAARITRCAYGIRSGSLRAIVPTASRVVRFGFLGGPHQGKGSSVLLAAFCDLDRVAELRMFGRFPQEIISEYGGRRVLFEGVVTGAEKLEALRHIDVLLVPSLFPDNSPLAIHEARAARIPVIGSMIGGITELVEEGRTGFLVSPGDVEALRDRMRWVVDHSSDVAKMRELIETFEEVDDHVRKLDQIYWTVKGGCL
jgi:glycosyltransferase involved in cell wall biosynthesis